MNNFVNVIQKLEELSARDSNQTQNINQLNSALYKVRTDMKQHLDAQSTDLHRIEDIATVLGYVGRVAAKIETWPQSVVETYIDLQVEGITNVGSGDFFLIKEGSDQGLYPIQSQDDGTGVMRFVIRREDKQVLPDAAVVVVKRMDDMDNLVEHIVCQLAGGVWNERTLLA